MFQRVQNSLEKFAAERPVLLAFLVFLGAAAVILPFSAPFYARYPQDFTVNVLSEALGMVFDLLVIGWFLFWLNKLAERRLENNRYREEIEDFLGWKSPEATHRIAGNIRRLNRGGVCEDIRLTDAFLKGANLQGAFLRDSDLWGATLEGANLVVADLRKVNLAGGHLEGADMERVRLNGSDLRGANLTDADIERGDLSGVDFRGALLINCDLQYSTLVGSNLERATLERANLRGANLRGADLERATLTNTSLNGANLEGANLMGVVLDGADLGNADLHSAILPHGEQLIRMFAGVKNLHNTHFDPGPDKHLKHVLHRLFESAYPRLMAEETEPAQ